MKKLAKTLICLLLTPILLFFNFQVYTTSTGYYYYDEKLVRNCCRPANPVYYDPKLAHEFSFTWATSKACVDMGFVGKSDQYQNDHSSSLRSSSGVTRIIDVNQRDYSFGESPTPLDFCLMSDPPQMETTCCVELIKNFPGNGLLGFIMGSIAFITLLIVFCLISYWKVITGVICAFFAYIICRRFGSKHHKYEIQPDESEA